MSKAADQVFLLTPSTVEVLEEEGGAGAQSARASFVSITGIICALITAYVVVLLQAMSWFPIRPGTPWSSLYGILLDLCRADLAVAPGDPAGGDVRPLVHRVALRAVHRPTGGLQRRRTVPRVHNVANGPSKVVPMEITLESSGT
jgi:hypothetical protein